MMNQVREDARRKGIVIIGAGQAGGCAAQALRAHGFAGDVTLIGAEQYPPYERPSLSKEMLLVRDAEPIAWVLTREALERQKIDFRADIAATAIDPAGRTILLSDGTGIGYGALILATGSRPRPLDVPGAAEAGILYLRTLDDSRALRARLRPGLRLLIVGAGFIGLEVAAAAIRRGLKVAIVEAATAPLARVAPPALGAYFASLHRGYGVSIHCETLVTGFERRGHVTIAHTGQGKEIQADIVVAGIGALPNAEVAAEAGLAVNRGIVTDEFGTTSAADIFAAGDVARQFHPLLGRHLMLESWQSAQNQAIAVAKNLAGPEAPVPYSEIPWFWSDQFGRNFQIYGVAVPGAESIVRDDGDGHWMLFQREGGKLVFAAAIDAARNLRPVRQIIASGVPVAAAALADPRVNIADLAGQPKRRVVSASW